MNTKIFWGLMLIAVLSVAGCKTTSKLEFVSPASGHRAVYGETVKIKLNFPNPTLDSVVYSIDGMIYEKKQDTTSLFLDTKEFRFGDRSLTARVYAGGREEIAYSTIMILPDSPKNYGFEIVNTYPHATDAFTQGLQYADGVLYESTGSPGGTDLTSSLRRVELTTGKVLQKKEIGGDYFGEGMTIVGDKIAFLTWKHNIGFFFDKKTFEELDRFTYGNSKDGWGLTYDGTHLIKSDGSNKLYFLDADSGKELDFVNVYDHNGTVDQLNELEYIEGKVYANVYQKDIIVIIDPKTGAVEGQVNLVGLYSEERQQYDNELNGIAYDPDGKRLFVTGKLWSKLFEIRLVER
ncbi:MAG TPA: glutaminyl-peptide cyclotransferase [Sphingobacterium sp.]|nr:glutaminyl-peptide cyclotransferase [Sphingobacterium sp.]